MQPTIESTAADSPATAVESTGDYRELKELVRRAGLLERRPVYHTFKILSTLGLLAASLLVLALVDNPVVQLLNAVLLAIAFTQIGFLGHDAGHGQVFRDSRNNRRLGLLLGNLGLGMSNSWWVDKHNRHHSHPNHERLDPDVVVPVIAFSEEQAASKRGISRHTVKYQAYLFFPFLAFEAIILRLDSIRYLLEKKPRGTRLEFALMAGHAVWYLPLVFYALPVGLAVAFVLVHQACFGIYLGSVFAPNHKGMLMTNDEMQLDFLREQVLTSRNVRPHVITDFVYGGLNYQIEHHLFPRLPRNRLSAARQITKSYCVSHAIPYHETSWLQSYREIMQHFDQVGAAAR